MSKGIGTPVEYVSYISYGITTENLTNIRENLNQAFDLDGLYTLAFDLGVDLEDFPEGKNAKLREMLRYLAQRERIPHLIERLQQVRPERRWGNMLPEEPEATSPYKGLQYFTEADQKLFFGRDGLTKQLLKKLRRERFVFMVGASGSGKSSLVRAGLVPAVRQGEIAGSGVTSADWPIHIITPGEQPLKTLAVSLTRDSESVTAANTLLQDLESDPTTLELFAMRQMNGQQNGRLLLVVDQFEELFTLCHDQEARQWFIDNLVQAVESSERGHLSLVLTMRADFYAYAVRYEGLRPLLETGQQIVGAMNRQELGDAILKPAVREGWRLENGLLEHILDDVSEDAGMLPLLSHALQQTWERRQGRLMTISGYVFAGGVGGAIARTADNVFNDFTEAEQTLAKSIFLRLTELGEGREDTRRRVWQSELIRNETERDFVRGMLHCLANARLITTSTQPDQDGQQREIAEVSHEALIREWPQLRAWLDENREWLRLHRQLTEAVKIYEANQLDESYLFGGNRLLHMAEWAEKYNNHLNESERRFIEVGINQKNKEDNARERLRQLELKEAKMLAATAKAQVEVERQKTIRTRQVFVSILVFVILFGVILQQPIQSFLLRQQAMGPKPVEIMASVDVPLGLNRENQNETLVEDIYPVIPAFRIEPYEVTNKRYNLCIQANACSPPGGLPSVYQREDRENYPVVNVTAIQAADFCQWIGRELPTDLQWERAARYIDGRSAPWGDVPDIRDWEHLDPSFAHFNQDGMKETAQEVGLTENGRSQEGVYDLVGNVWEMTRSYYELDFGNWLGPPEIPDGSLTLSMRGGGFIAAISHLAERTEISATGQLDFLGFRCVELIN